MNTNLQFYTDGEAYERMMGRWSQLAGATFLDWLAAPKDLSWLDVGSGNGTFTEVLITRCAPTAVQGIDPSEAQIAYARTRDAAKLAHFDTGDAQSLSFGEASFDVATMALVISFIPDQDKAVREMARVVLPGGWVATYMWDIPGGGLPQEPFRTAAKALGLSVPPPITGSEVTQRDGLHALWERAGLEDIETRRIDVQVTYTDFDDFWQPNMALPAPTVQYVSKLPPSDKERVKEWLHESLPKDAQGRISYGAHANAVKGRVPEKG